MDPATAIGLVSGILSFVTFAGDLVKSGVEIYRHGDLTENATLQDVVGRMDMFHERLTRLTPTGEKCHLSDDEAVLVELAKDCRNVATELLRLLESMRRRLDLSGYRAKWNTIVATWNSVIRAKDKAELEEKLGRCQTRLTTVLTWSSTISVHDLTSAAAKSEKGLQRVQKTVEELKSLLQFRDSQEPDWFDASAERLIHRLIGAQEQTIFRVVNSRILQALQYGRMRDRSGGLQHRVDEIQEQQHGKTFQWVFEPDQVLDLEDSENGERQDGSELEKGEPDDADELEMKRQAREKYTRWLSIGNGIFHVAGKLGSGKSTLMQLLSGHHQTRRRLEAWAGDRTLVTVIYHFSTVVGGTQQVLAGLYRSILHDIIAAHPQLAVDLLPEHWKAAADLHWQAQGSNLDINSSAVLAALRKLFRDDSYSDYCFCIFLDALDEYQDPEGRDQADLVKMLFEWAPQDRPNVKLCVSSREEPAFYNKFPADQTFQLHRLTRYDMERFVSERLQHLEDKELLRRLVSEIPKKSQGIFLWTQLVVGEIREDMDSTGTIDLDVLGRFPDGLEPLIDRAFNTIRPRYRTMAYSTFAMLRFSKNHSLQITAVAYSFLEEYCKNPEFVYHMPVTEALNMEVLRKPRYGDYHDRRVPTTPACSQRISRATSQLRAWCKGLVEMSTIASREGYEDLFAVKVPQGVLTFTHRSISEYFEESRVKATLQEKLGDLPIYALSIISQLYLGEFILDHPLLADPSWDDQKAREMYPEWFHDFRLLDKLLILRSKFKLDLPPYRFLNRFQDVSDWVKGAILQLEPWGAMVQAVASSFSCRFNTLSSSELRMRIPLYSPLHSLVYLGHYGFPTWKLNQDRAKTLDDVSLASLLRSCIDANYDIPDEDVVISGENQFFPVLLPGLEQIWEKRLHIADIFTSPPTSNYGGVGNDPYEIHDFFGKTDKLGFPEATVWQYFLIYFYLSIERLQLDCPWDSRFRANRRASFGYFAEGFLRSGHADARVSVTRFVREERPVVKFVFLEDGNFIELDYLCQVPRSRPWIEDAGPYKITDSFSWQEWIEREEFPNKATLLQLIKRNLSKHREPQITPEGSQDGLGSTMQKEHIAGLTDSTELPSTRSAQTREQSESETKHHPATKTGIEITSSQDQAPTSTTTKQQPLSTSIANLNGYFMAFLLGALFSLGISYFIS